MNAYGPGGTAEHCLWLAKHYRDKARAAVTGGAGMAAAGRVAEFRREMRWWAWRWRLSPAERRERV